MNRGQNGELESKPAIDPKTGQKLGGLGLTTMTMRASKFGGTVRFEPIKPKGTKVIVKIPLNGMEKA